MISEAMSARLREACAGDGEFLLAARYWTGGLRLEGTSAACAVRIDRGEVVAGDVRRDDEGAMTLRADDAVWAQLLAARPPRLVNDISGLLVAGQMKFKGDPLRYAQYFPAIMRAVELLRPPAPPERPASRRPAGAFDAPVGRYIHLDIGGDDHRVYFEQAGAGIPLLLQHTAGSHGVQWRHLFECPEITDHFRLIAYDLPFHGKSLPPTGRAWWREEYKLTGAFLRAVPVTLARALGLARPVFMGCSVGGLLALDLALHHPDLFSAVISLEGALHIATDVAALAPFWHPQVSNEYKARLMNGLMCPTSPESLRKETTQAYAAGWPPVFLGDLNYYLHDYDLRERAHEIDTTRVQVHILSGEYDSSGTQELGKAAHEAIAGSTWTAMDDLGHFPMSENPELFLQYLLPVLRRVRATAQQ